MKAPSSRRNAGGKSEKGVYFSGTASAGDALKIKELI
jgi:hypothetical protein